VIARLVVEGCDDSSWHDASDGKSSARVEPRRDAASACMSCQTLPSRSMTRILASPMGWATCSVPAAA
jgi:hypothetical protein